MFFLLPPSSSSSSPSTGFYYAICPGWPSACYIDQANPELIWSPDNPLPTGAGTPSRLSCVACLQKST